MSSSLLLHLIVTFIRLARPGGLRSIVAESVLVKHQPLIPNRAPNLGAAERMVAGLCVLFMNPARVLRCAIVLKPSTLLDLHRILAQRKYPCCFRPSAGVSLARKEQTENSSTQ